MQRGYRLGMKDHRKKRRSEQHVEEEANFIGDILKLLFALSLAIVAIVVCFLFFKNIAGFSLPNLKATEAASESSKEAVVITEATKESKKKETEARTEKTTEESSEEETSTKSEESNKESTKESTAGQKSSKSHSSDDAVVGEGPKSADDSGDNQGPGQP